MATTHYAELKIYALETPGVVNASCEFDVESLAPTYKLSVGVPGKSNAFLISAKLGIPESVIDAARNHMSNDDKRLDSVLAQLDDLKLQLKAAEDEAEKARYEAEHALESAEKKRDALIKQGEEELEATRRKAHELMQNVQNQAYALTDELRRIQKDEKTNAAARAVRAREIARKDTEQLLNRTEKKQPKRQFVPLKEVKPGQEVVIAELDQHAVVLSRPDKNGMVEVRAGILKTKVPLTGLCAPDKMDKRTQKQEPPRTPHPRGAEPRPQVQHGAEPAGVHRGGSPGRSGPLLGPRHAQQPEHRVYHPRQRHRRAAQRHPKAPAHPPRGQILPPWPLW